MLRFYRERAGLSREHLGQIAHVSGSLIVAYETGKRVPTRHTTAQLDTAPELGTGGALIALWDQFQESMNYRGFLDWFQEWWEVEATARRLRSSEPSYVPGLLQTEDYARAVFRCRIDIADDEIEELVAARLQRQEILTRDHPPELWLILDESVLRRPVGGPHVMLEQITRLIDAAQRQRVVLQVIPASVGAHLGLIGAFVLADFDDVATIGYQDAPIRDEAVRAADRVAKLELIWDTLCAEALPRQASLALLEEAAKSWASKM